MSSRRFCSIILFLFFIILSACSPQEVVIPEDPTPTLVPTIQSEDPEPSPEVIQEQEQLPEEITLNWNLQVEPPTLDPALATGAASSSVIRNTFVSLTQLHPETGAAEPFLATSWDVNETGDVYTFHLRDDIQWVQYNAATREVVLQRPLTAQDVEYGVKRSIDPITASRYAYILYVIKNAKAVNAGEEGITLDDVGVKALDDTTVEFTLEYPAAYFPGIASMWVASPQPKEAIDQYGDRWVEPGFFWTSGPYVVTEWIHGGSLRLEKNPYWIGADDVQIDVVDCVIITEASTGFAMYENNELDYAAVPLPDVPRVKADPVLSKEFYNAPSACTYYLGFVETKPPFDDVRVRTAFSAAIDRETLVEQVLQGGQMAATSFAPPGIFGAPVPGTVGLGYDPELAKSTLQDFLDEKGLADGEAFVKEYDPVFGYNTDEGNAQIAASLQAMWDEVLGVNVRIENQEWKVYLDTINKNTPVEDTFDIFRMTWCGDYPDENNWVREVFHFDESSNRFRRQCADPNCSEFTGPAEFDELVVNAALEKDPAKRIEMYAQAEDIISKGHVDAAFIYHYTTVGVVKPWLQRNFPMYGGSDFYNWKIDWEAKQAVVNK